MNSHFLKMVSWIKSQFISVKDGLNSGNPFAVGVSLTKVFLGAVLLILILPQGGADGWKVRFWGLMTSPSNEIGDTFAGIAGVLAFLWIIVTVWLQSQELAAQREELKEQREEFEKMNSIMDSEKFEAMVFEFIKTHNEIVSSIEIEAMEAPPTLSEVLLHRVTYRGRGCFPYLYKKLSSEYQERKKKHGDRVALYYAYKKLWNEYGHLLGHYYRFLFNAFRTISESTLAEPHHSRLMRSQISDYELLLLFYNCISPRGEKFTKYAREFSLFDNLPSIKVLDHAHWDLLPGTFGDNPLLKPGEFRDWEEKYISKLMAAEE